MQATAIAHSNIALAKYWGKRDVPGNVPATPSVSVTLSHLHTRTHVMFDPSLNEDSFRLNNSISTGEPLLRVTKLLNEVRQRANLQLCAQVTSENNFPTASGLASSASGFAALAMAACKASRLTLTTQELSRIARRASASAARSLFEGFVSLDTYDNPAAEMLAPASHWPSLSLVVAAVTLAPKVETSTHAMVHTRETSPYYSSWKDDAVSVAQDVRTAILNRDIQQLGEAAECSALRMHACAMSAAPGILYWSAKTLELIHCVYSLRRAGIGAWFTMDAGPHVKIICEQKDTHTIAELVRVHCAYVQIANPGPAAYIT